MLVLSILFILHSILRGSSFSNYTDRLIELKYSPSLLDFLVCCKISVDLGEQVENILDNA